VVWIGDMGQVSFYQSELPYDVTQVDYRDAGYASYRLGEGVRPHNLAGDGVYS